MCLSTHVYPNTLAEKKLDAIRFPYHFNSFSNNPYKVILVYELLEEYYFDRPTEFWDIMIEKNNSISMILRKVVISDETKIELKQVIDI